MNDQTTIDFELLAQSDPKELVAQAYRWVQEHLSVWDRIVGAAQRDVLDGIRVSTKFYIEDARRRPASWAAETVKLPNAFSPAFARFLAAWHPELADHINLQSSKLDGCTIPPRPY